MYHQILHIGEECIPAVIEYSEDETGPIVIDKITVIDGPIIPTGAYPADYLEELADQLARRHDGVISDLNAMYRADRAADRAAFKEAYA